MKNYRLGDMEEIYNIYDAETPLQQGDFPEQFG